MRSDFSLKNIFVELTVDDDVVSPTFSFHDPATQGNDKPEIQLVSGSVRLHTLVASFPERKLDKL